MTSTAHLNPTASPEFILSEEAAHCVDGVEVIALAVVPAAAAGDSPLLGPGSQELADELKLDLLGLVESFGMTGSVGEVETVAVAASELTPSLRMVTLVGVGQLRSIDVRRAGAALGRAIKGRSMVATGIAGLNPDGIDALVVGLTLGSFQFSMGAEDPASAPVGRVVLSGMAPDADGPVLARAVASAAAGWRSRLLATVPSNVKNPAWLAEQAQAVASESGLTCLVWDEVALAAEGFGGLIGVGQASATPPRLIRLDYKPKKTTSSTKTVVLVGKGITFDSGGLSIKPGQAMATMKRDMSGGAAVIAAMAGLSEMDCPVRVVGLVPAAENAVSGNSLRPGDVIEHFGGRTSEVTNTDAEGRLVMADALSYAVSEIEPDVIVDVATLTGAVKVALGQQVGGIFSNDDGLADSLIAAGERTGEPLWRLPLHQAYAEKLSSKVADADNAPSGPGAIMAALFLRHFVGDVPWAHLDLASVGDVPEDLHEWTAGPSGFGPRLLLCWLAQGAPLTTSTQARP